MEYFYTICLCLPTSYCLSIVRKIEVRLYNCITSRLKMKPKVLCAFFVGRSYSFNQIFFNFGWWGVGVLGVWPLLEKGANLTLASVGKRLFYAHICVTWNHNVKSLQIVFNFVGFNISTEGKQHLQDYFADVKATSCEFFLPYYLIRWHHDW